MKLILAILLSLTSLFASDAFAAHQLASDINGKVVNADKVAQVGVVVVLENLDTGRVIVRKTNKKGRYHFSNVRPDCNFRVTVISPKENAYSFTGGVSLGMAHKRNFVVDYAPEAKPDFMKSWIWSMEKADVLNVDSFMSIGA